MKTGESGVIPISLGFVKVFLIKGERAILVDTGYPGTAGKILAALAANGVAPQEIGLIVITHAHSDHVGSLKALQAQTGAKVAIQQAEAEALRLGKNADICPHGFVGHLFKLLTRVMSRLQRVEGVNPDIVITQELDLTPFGVNGKVLATSGHTSGSASVVLSNDEIILGDLLMAFGRTRVPGWPMFVNDFGQLQESLRFLLSFHPKTMHASHGGPFDPSQVADLLQHAR